MNGNHKIRSLGVHTRFDSEALAMECQKALSAFAGERLPRIMDEVFSSRSSPGLIRRFERVELDLGAIPRDEFPDGIEERLRKKLEDFLDDHPVLPEPVSSAASRRQIPSGMAEEETILYFLETGILPWYGSFSKAGDMAASLEQCLETGAAHFIKRLKNAPDMKTMVKRLIRQFPEGIIEKILDMIVQDRGRSTREIIRWLDECYAAGTGEKPGKDPGSGADTVQEIKDYLWEHILLITLGCGISSKRLKLALPQHSSPEFRQEIFRIWGEVILHCFDALVDDIQIKEEREPHQGITDRSLDNGPDKQNPGDPGLSPAKGKSVRESTGKEGVNEAIEERVLNNLSLLLYPGARASRLHFYCGRDARAPRLNYFERVPEPDNGVRAKAGNITLKNGITRDGTDTGMTGQSTENIAGPSHGDSRDGNLEPVSSAASPRQLPFGPAEGEEDATFHFLETGILPWHESFSNAGDMAASLEKCLETGAAHFIKRLKDALDMKTMVKRLIRRFPDAIIEKILETVAPGRGRSTRAVIRRLDACYAAGTVRKVGKDLGSGADTVQEIKDHVWEHILSITLGAHDISHRCLKLELPQHSSPEARQEISRIWGEVILRCFDALAEDIQDKGERESHQAITDLPLDNRLNKQTSGDPGLSYTKGKPVRDSIAKEVLNEAAELDNGVRIRTKAGNTTLRNGITKDEADTGMTGQSTENFAGPTEEEAILHFLETGILPGYGSFSKAGDMAAFLEKCLETGAAHFIKRLKDAPDMKIMVRRLTRRFPEVMIEKILKPALPQHSSPEARQEISWIWEAVILRCFDALAYDILVKGERESYQAITDRPLADCPGKQTLGDPGLSPAKGKSAKESTGKDVENQVIEERVLNNSSILLYPGARASRPHVYCGRDARAPRLNHFERVPESDNGVRVKAGSTTLRTEIIKDGADKGMTDQSQENIAGPSYGEFRDGNPGPVSSASSPRQRPAGSVEEEAILYFLETGILPGCGSFSNTGHMAASLEKCLETGAAHFIKRLKDALDTKTMVKRLTRQFPEAIIEKILETLVPGRGRSTRAVTLHCFDALAGDIQVKVEREPPQAITDYSPDNRPGEQALGDQGISSTKGKPVRESTGKEVENETIESDNGVRAKAGITKDGAATGMTDQLKENIARPSHGDFRDGNLDSGLPLGQASVPRGADRSVPDPGPEDRYDSMNTNPGISTGLKRLSELLGNPAVQRKLRSSLNLEDIWDMIQATLHWKSREPYLEGVRERFKSDACAQSRKSLDEKRDDSRDQLADKLSLILKSGPDPKDFLFRVLIGLVSSDPHQEHDPGEKPKSSVPGSGKLENPPGETHLKQAGDSRPTWNSSGYQPVTAVERHPAAASREWGRRSEPIFIENAGMVLSGPYLPMLFGKLDLLDNKEFKSRYAAEKAVHILEYMVTGEQSAPEYRLVLNKLLCGMEPDRPIHQLFMLEKAETDLTRELILSMIAHWKTLGKTSVEGFRQSFLIREGRLEATEDAWTLVVAPKPFDMLLDRIPWTFSPIRLPWMDRVLHVRWR